MLRAAIYSPSLSRVYRTLWSCSTLFSLPCPHSTCRRHKSCGIVGLPNVGKSVLFNALTQSQLAEAANYPFCTIEPNIASVSVKDRRLEQLAKAAGSARTVFTQMEFVDIAGLIAGAHKGAGLGNKFLSNIRDVDSILHVLRCFDDSEIVHVAGKTDPLADMAVIEEELLLADLGTIEKRIENAEKKAKTSKDVDSSLRLSVLSKCRAALDAGVAIIDVAWSQDELPLVTEQRLLTHKPLACVCNVKETDAATGNTHSQRVKTYIDQLNHTPPAIKSLPGIRMRRSPRMCVHVCAQLEADAAAGFDSEEARRDFLALSNLTETSLDQVIVVTASLLHQQVFFTVGPDEARAWTIRTGSTAVEAASKIHSDIAQGFIAVEVIKPADWFLYGSEQAVKAAGKMTVEGKNYVVQDGDLLHFRFNVSKGGKH